MKNHYHTLGLSFEAKPENQVIVAAYKALVKLYHPDVFRGDKKLLKRKISEINEAYEILKDQSKKEIYDQKLNNYQKKNYTPSLDEEFFENELFNKNFVDDDWEVAMIVYPELEKKQLLLENYSHRLGLQCQFYLLETKEFHKLDLIIESFIDAFLEKKFGTSKDIKNLAKLLIENKLKEPALYLNKIVKVIGSSSEKRILNAFFKEHEDLKDKFSSQLNYGKTIRKNILNQSFDHSSANIVAIFLIVIFVIYIFSISFFS